MRRILFGFILLTAVLTASEPIENLNSLFLRDNNLKPLAPLMGEKDNLPGFTRELIQVQWRPGDPIYLFVIRPKGVAKPPVILYLYGFPSDTNRFMDNEFCELTVKNGFAAVGFVSALTGHRYHDRPMKEWFVSELKESLVTTVHDVEMILNYVETRADLDASRVGMFGEGSGAVVAALAATADPRIQALDLLDSWGDWPEWLAHTSLIPDDERAGFLRPEFLRQVAPLDPTLALRKLTGIPVRIHFLTRPAVDPLAVRDRLVKAAPAQAIVVSPEQARADLSKNKGNDMFDWIKQQPVFTRLPAFPKSE